MNTTKQTDDMVTLLNMQIDEFISINKEYLKSIGKSFYETGGGGIIEPFKCPLHFWVVHNHAKGSKEFITRTASCPLCNNPVCPDCMNHNVEQLSRVTGYLGGVSGWNAAKKQEFVDRKRYNP